MPNDGDDFATVFSPPAQSGRRWIQKQTASLQAATPSLNQTNQRSSELIPLPPNPGGFAGSRG